MKNSPLEATLRLLLTDRLPVLSVGGDMHALLGIANEDYLNGTVSILDRVHPHDAGVAALLFSSKARERRGWCNLRLRHADGRIRLIHAEYDRKAGGQELILRLQDGKMLSRRNPDVYQASMEAMDCLDDFVTIKDRNHLVVAGNSAYRQAVAALFGAEAEWLGRCDYEMLPEHYADLFYRMEEDVLAGAASARETHEIETNNGVRRWIDVRKYPYPNAHSGAQGVLTLVRDVSESKWIEERMRFALQVFQDAPQAIAITDAKGILVNVNPLFTRITGYSREEVVDKPVSILKSGRQDKKFYERMWTQLRETGHWQGEIWNRRKDGSVYPEMLTIGAVRDEDNVVRRFVAMFADLSEFKERERELERSLHYDALTGLPNRTLMENRLRSAMQHMRSGRQCMAVMEIDLDGFREVNHLRGREAGDKVLRTVAERLKKLLQRGDTLARLGGDGFVLIAQELENEQAASPLLAGILRAACEPTHLADAEIQLTASMGVTFYPQEEEVEPEQLLRQAAHALYQAKLEGRNRYCVFEQLRNPSERHRIQIVEQLRVALKEHQLMLYYQPKVNMATGQVVGAEALIRWMHPQRGLLSPASFLPMIEDHPLAEDVGAWVLDTVLTQMEAWIRTGVELPVSVNVSAQQIHQEDFVSNLKAALEAHPTVLPDHLELEIPDPGVGSDPQQLAKVVEECRELGVTFALDDFGTGSSSLHDLKHSPADVLKIDSRFIRDILENPKEISILEGVLGLAAAYKRKSIAEGVESVDHGLALLRLGCEVAQGYGIAHPMPAAELPEWIQNWKPDPRWVAAMAESSDNWLLAAAREEHANWLESLDAYFTGTGEKPHSISRHQCRLGSWLDAEIQAGRGSHPDVQSITALHYRIHAIGASVLKMPMPERGTEALEKLVELHDLLNKMIAMLEEMHTRG